MTTWYDNVVPKKKTLYMRCILGWHHRVSTSICTCTALVSPPNLEENWLKWIKSVVHAGCMMVEKRINKTLWAASIRDNGATLDTMVQQHKKYITVHSGTLPVDRRERCDIYGRISIQIAGSFSRSSLYNLSVKPHLSHCELWPRSHQ